MERVRRGCVFDSERSGGGIGSETCPVARYPLFLVNRKQGNWYELIAMSLSIQNRAPEFVLLDQSGHSRALADFLGQWVVLYFYPKDDTPGCTKEACGFRDGFVRFKRSGIVVLGVSADSVKKHAKFVEKYALPFLLLADEDKTVVERYGVWAKKKFMGREYMGILRTTFLIDPEGKIAKIYGNVKPEEHAEEVLAEILRLTTGQKEK